MTDHEYIAPANPFSDSDGTDWLPMASQVDAAIDGILAEARAVKNAESAARFKKLRAEGNRRRREERSAAKTRMAEDLAALAKRYEPPGSQIVEGTSTCSVRTEVSDSDGTPYVVVPPATSVTTLYRRLLGFARIRGHERSDNGHLRRPSWQCLWQAHLLAASWMSEIGKTIPPKTALATARQLETLTARIQAVGGPSQRRDLDAARQFIAAARR